MIDFLRKIYYWFFPRKPLPIFHVGNRVRVFLRDTGEMIFVGEITKLSYPGDEYRRYIRETFKELISKRGNEWYVLGLVESNGEEFVFSDPTYHRVELLPEDRPPANTEEYLRKK